MPLPSLDPWKDLSLEEIYHPIFQSAFIYEPIFLWPLPLAYVNSFFELGQNYLFHFWALSIAIIIAGIHALFLSFAYRIVPIYKEVHAVPEIQAAFISDVPILAEVFKLRPNAAGYHPKMMSEWINVLIIDGVLAMILLPVAFLIMHFIFISRMKRTEKVLSKSTFKVQRMLYKARALTVQLLVSILFLFLPIGAFVGVYVLQFRHGSIYANLCISVAGFDIIFNAFSILYFVKPYNVFMQRKFKRYTVHAITSSTMRTPKIVTTSKDHRTAQTNLETSRNYF
uniref:G protein-coupled receptor n=1 Tax=Panagrolaimus davidi TaxID=227884 RepID=A0A914P0T7_9BILA